MNKRLTCLYILLGLLYCCSNASKTSIKQVTWAGSSHSFADTLISQDGKDTLFNFKHLYLAHSISLQDNGEGILITRSEYDAPREFYSIVVNDSLRKIVFDLLIDTAILKFKQPAYDPDKETRLYCGYNYLLTIVDQDNQEHHINYLPPDANEKLKYLQSLFEILLANPTIKGKTQIDTLTFDSVIFEKMQKFNPMPPLRSTVKFEPPKIDARK